jgi:hypothetical protein
VVITRVARLTGLKESIETRIIVLKIVLLAVLVGQRDTRAYDSRTLAGKTAEI